VIADVAWWGDGVGGGSVDVWVRGFFAFTRRRGGRMQIGLACAVLRIERGCTGMEIYFCLYEEREKCINGSSCYSNPRPYHSIDFVIFRPSRTSLSVHLPH